MISVLCPSRGRPVMLDDSLKCFNEKEVEFLVAADEDDPRLGSYQDLDYPLTITKRYGYPYLEKYYNILAKKAKGDWLFLWNDDASVGTSSIEGLLSELDPSEPLVAYFGGDTRFPLISRGLYELLGHYAAGPAVDSYLHAIAVEGGAIRYVADLNFGHERDRMDDPTSQQKELGIVDERMKSDEVVNQRLADIEKVRQWFLSQQGESDV